MTIVKQREGKMDDVEMEQPEDDSSSLATFHVASHCGIDVSDPSSLTLLTLPPSLSYDTLSAHISAASSSSSQPPSLKNGCVVVIGGAGMQAVEMFS